MAYALAWCNIALVVILAVLLCELVAVILYSVHEIIDNRLLIDRNSAKVPS